jgi:hypothetical protein
VRLTSRVADSYDADIDYCGYALREAYFSGKDEVGADACCQPGGERWCADPSSDLLNWCFDHVDQLLLAAIEHGVYFFRAKGARHFKEDSGLIVSRVSDILGGRVREPFA